jgi:ABC-type transport system involved in cytochrome bd biosynthesis fused ATPase/permease subunit
VSGITIGGINIKFAALSLTIVVLLILGAMIIFYFTRRVSRLKAALVGKEIREARESIREGFSELRQNMLDELRMLESQSALSAEELARKELLLRNLEKLEKGMEKEIGDIEEKL